MKPEPVDIEPANDDFQTQDVGAWLQFDRRDAYRDIVLHAACVGHGDFPGQVLSVRQKAEGGAVFAGGYPKIHCEGSGLGHVFISDFNRILQPLTVARPPYVITAIPFTQIDEIAGSETDLDWLLVLLSQA